MADRLTRVPDAMDCGTGRGRNAGLAAAARDYRIDWRLTSAVRGDPGFTVDLDATRCEAANGNEPAEHGVMLRGAIRW